MIKVDLHMHTGEDPEDGLPYPSTAIIDKAVDLGFAAIAITLHCKVLENERLFEYARRKGLLLIRAVEWTIHGRDVLLYNVTQREVESLRTFDDLREFRRERGENLLVVAPHPLYPLGHSLRKDFEPNIDLFDAAEYAHMHLSWFDLFNQRALRVARKHNKPVIANSDSHSLWMFGRHHTFVDAEPAMASIFQAIREGRVEWQSPPISVWDCLRMLVFDPLLERSPGKTVESCAGQPAK